MASKAERTSTAAQAAPERPAPEESSITSDADLSRIIEIQTWDGDIGEIGWRGESGTSASRHCGRAMS
jgi:hypothetical protein